MDERKHIEKVYRRISIVVFISALSIVLMIILIPTAFENDMIIPLLILGIILYIVLFASCIYIRKLTPKIKKYKKESELEALSNKYNKYVAKIKQWENNINKKLKTHNINFMDFYDKARKYSGQKHVFSKGGITSYTSFNVIRNDDLVILTTIPISELYYYHFYKYKKIRKKYLNTTSSIIEGTSFDEIKNNKHCMEILERIDLDKERELFVFDIEMFSSFHYVSLVDSIEYLKTKPTSGMELAVKSELFGTAYTLLSEFDKINRMESMRYDIGMEYFGKVIHFDIRDKAWFEHVLPECVRR